jgi:hypothetical protein
MATFVPAPTTYRGRLWDAVVNLFHAVFNLA